MTTTNNEGVLTEPQAAAADPSASNGNPSAANPASTSSSTSMPPSTPDFTPTSNFNGWSSVSPSGLRQLAPSSAALEDTRVRVGLGGVLVLMLVASIVTAIVVRRRADARARKAVWLAVISSASGALAARARAVR